MKIFKVTSNQAGCTCEKLVLALDEKDALGKTQTCNPEGATAHPTVGLSIRRTAKTLLRADLVVNVLAGKSADGREFSYDLDTNKLFFHTSRGSIEGPINLDAGAEPETKITSEVQYRCYPEHMLVGWIRNTNGRVTSDTMEIWRMGVGDLVGLNDDDPAPIRIEKIERRVVGTHTLIDLWGRFEEIPEGY